MPTRLQKFWFFEILVTFFIFGVSLDLFAIGEKEPNLPAEQTAPDLSIPHWNLNPFVASRGYRMGFLSQTRLEGYLVKTLEGNLQLGYLSSSSPGIDQTCMEEKRSQLSDHGTPDEEARAQAKAECQEMVNPWPYSGLCFSYDQKRKIDRINQAVLLSYRRFRVFPFTETNNVLQDVWPVSPDLVAIGDYFDAESSLPVSRHLHYENGSIDGRFVQATVQGNIRENYLATIQLGPSGNNFIRMNIPSSSLYDFIVKCMASGRFLRIHYFRLYGIESWPSALLTGTATRYRITRVEVIAEPNL